jgi:hypothetical protein
LEKRYFWALDEGNYEAPHAVVAAPPFGVVDVTVLHQPYEEKERMALPPFIMAKDWTTVKAEPEDIANNQIRYILNMQRIRFNEYFGRVQPDMKKVINMLTPHLVKYNDTLLKYVVVAVGGAKEQLEHISGYNPCGRTALEIFENDIKKRL